MSNNYDLAAQHAMMGAIELQPVSKQCKRCNSTMHAGKAIEQTFTGVPDFANSGYVCTLSPGGAGKLVDCLKCRECGFSVTK